MARSTYVYVVAWADRVGSAAPLNAATVKRELADWLTRMRDINPRVLDDVEVWRLTDVGAYFGGGIDGPNRTHLGTAAEFLDKERPGEASGV